MINFSSLESIASTETELCKLKNYLKKTKNNLSQQAKLFFGEKRSDFFSSEFVFIHIAKCGGTSFKNRLIDTRVFTSRRHSINYKTALKRHKLVFILRDPLERFVSSFYSRLSFSTNNITALSLKDQKFYQLYPTVNDYVVELAGDLKRRKSLMLNTLQLSDHLSKWGSYYDYFPRISTDLIKSKSHVIMHSDLNCGINAFAKAYDLHLSNDVTTKRKRPLSFPALDKNFHNFMRQELKDEYLFYDALTKVAES